MDTSDDSVPQWAPSTSTSLLILIVSIALTFGQVIFAEFVWDDKNLILNNPWMRHSQTIIDTWKSDFWALTNGGGSSGMYRPMVILVYWVEFKLFGTNPMGFHAMTLMLHAFNTVLVLKLCQTKTNGIAALLASAVFALHPVQVEAASNIASHTDLMATTGILVSLLLWTRPHWRWACTLFIFLALCSKESAIVGPILIVLFHRTSSTVKSLIQWLLPPIALWLVLRLSAVGITSQATTEGWEGAFRMAHYIGRVFYPIVSGPITELSPPSPFQVGLLTTLFIGTIGWLLKTFHTHRSSILIILISLMPVSEIMPLGARFSDLLLYLPMVGFSLLIAELLGRFRVNKRSHTVQKTMLVIAIIPMMAISSSRSLNWKNDLALWSHAAQFSSNLTVRLNLANALRSSGEREKGCILLKQAHASKADPADRVPMSRVAFNLGNCAREAQDWDTAKQLYRQSIELTQAKFFPARYNLIVTEDASGQIDQAIELAEQLCHDMPLRADAWHINGVMLAKVGLYEKAIHAFKQSLSLVPDHQKSLEYLQKSIELQEQTPPL